MAIVTTLQIGDPILKAKNSLVTKFNTKDLKRIIDDLADTMHANKLVGMAAPQIGVNLKVFITEPRKTNARKGNDEDTLRVYINPEVVDESKEKVEIFEGCGSVMRGKLFGPVVRPKIVTIEAYDIAGRKFRMRADGLLGRVIWHENDHMYGKEFLEKVSDYDRMMNLEHYIEHGRHDPINVKNSMNTIKEFEYLA